MQKQLSSTLRKLKKSLNTDYYLLEIAQGHQISEDGNFQAIQQNIFELVPESSDEKVPKRNHDAGEYNLETGGFASSPQDHDKLNQRTRSDDANTFDRNHVTFDQQPNNTQPLDIETLLVSHMNLNSSNQIIDQILNNLQGLTPEQELLRDNLQKRVSQIQSSNVASSITSNATMPQIQGKMEDIPENNKSESVSSGSSNQAHTLQKDIQILDQ